ncbi:MAG: B12-binding domain-containing radical SAM protein [Bacteroidetes bacterium]|nr:B12-binding domain-containing radical SAM protein [Bacteroidota bacterium]
MKVLLVYPNIHGMNMLPPAIGLFTALLRERGHIVDFFDSTNYQIPEETFDSDKEKEKILTVRPFDDSKLREGMHDTDVFDDFFQKIQKFQPGLVAFSVTEDLFPVACGLMSKIEDIDVPTIFGGVFPTFAPYKCLALKGVDMVCIGEGEKLIVELADRLESGKEYCDIPGLWVKKKEGIKKNLMGNPIDFSQNPMLDLSLFEDSRLYRPMQGKVWRMLPAETHRGCPYQCTYCNSPAQSKMYRKDCKSNFYRKKSFEAIHKELTYFKNEHRAEAYYFWADTFLSYTDKEFDQFCELYEDIRLPFWVQSRPETINENRIKRLMDLGLFRMGFGVEHGNDQFRANVLRRKVSNAVMLKGFKILNKLELKFSVNNIMGFPGETRSLAMDTVNLNAQISCDSANAYSFSPFHGTPLRKISEEMGFCDKDLIARSVMKPTLLNMPQFPPDAIEGLRRCFTLYIRMAKSRWPEIEKAEKLTPEGNEIWESLRTECAEKYFTEID